MANGFCSETLYLVRFHWRLKKLIPNGAFGSTLTYLIFLVLFVLALKRASRTAELLFDNAEKVFPYLDSKVTSRTEMVITRFLFIKSF